MLLITCPHCGPRAQVEFIYERTLDSIVPLDAEPGEAMSRLYARENPRGVSEELWRHTHGCRAWLLIVRHRISHDITCVSAYPESSS